MASPLRTGRSLVTMLTSMGAAALLLATLVSAAGCGGEEADPTALDGTSWRLARWSESAQDPADFTITAQFDDGRVGGQSAVNSYGGPYTTGPAGEFSTGEIVSTMMAGPAPAMRAEQTYLELLQAAATYEVVAGTLTLYDEFGAEALVFASSPPTDE